MRARYTVPGLVSLQRWVSSGMWLLLALWRWLTQAAKRAGDNPSLWNTITAVLFVFFGVLLSIFMGIEPRIVVIGAAFVCFATAQWLLVNRAQKLSVKSTSRPALMFFWVIFIVSSFLLASAAISLMFNWPAPIQHWLTGSQIIKSISYPGTNIVCTSHFANDIFFENADSTKDRAKKEALALDRWKEWMTRGAPISEGDFSQQMIVVQSQNFSESYKSFNAEVSLNGPIVISDAVAFLVMDSPNPDSENPLYRPTYRQMRVSVGGEEKRTQLYLANPKANEYLLIILICRHRDGEPLPHSAENYYFTLPVISE